MRNVIRIGTRESELAVWQANNVRELLSQNGFPAELVYIKSEGDIDLKTPLYEMGVQGVFTRNLDSALLNDRIDIAVHSMKDVPTQLPQGIIQSAVLQRASHKDLLVYKDKAIVDSWQLTASKINSPLGRPRLASGEAGVGGTIATCSIRRKSQWLHRYPHHSIVSLRGNVNTRLRKVQENSWDGAIFAAAGLERINLRPENSIELDWMLPAPAQGAIMLVCREADNFIFDACQLLNNSETALCTKIERDFLRILLGGCSTPISALAEVADGKIHFMGNILSTDGKEKATIERSIEIEKSKDAGKDFAIELLNNGGQSIVEGMHNATK